MYKNFIFLNLNVFLKVIRLQMCNVLESILNSISVDNRVIVISIYISKKKNPIFIDETFRRCKLIYVSVDISLIIVSTEYDPPSSKT